MRVVNSYFENLGVAEVLRTEHCYVTLTGQHEVNIFGVHISILGDNSGRLQPPVDKGLECSMNLPGQ